MNILAIDYGQKNIGLAWCNTGIGAVLPFGIAKDMLEVVEVIKNENIDQLVVGLPLGIDSKENSNTYRVREKVEEIKNIINIPIDFFDERFSSQAADRLDAGVSRDEKSAMIILEDWLASRK